MSYSDLSRRISLALFVITTAQIGIAPGFAQSLDPKNPAPLQSGFNQGVIDSFGGEQFWQTTVSGHFRIVFNRQDAQEGFNLAKAGFACVMAPKTANSTLGFKESATSVVYEGNAASPTRIVAMVEPAKSPLVRQTNKYTIQVEGGSGGGASAPSSSFSSGSAPSSGGGGGGGSVVGVYDVNMNDYGAAKLNADGTIVTTSGAKGTWECFDADTRTYVIKIDNVRWTLTFEPARGFVDKNGQMLLTAKHR
ncbi:MAG TPA: hypothetical protein V6C76_03875 [Drouetiella sp.]